jgi:exodeoxyribonuclease V beta subunit
VTASPGELAALLRKVVQTPLSADTAHRFCLADLDQGQTIREMPFYLRLAPGSTDELNTILSSSPTFRPVSPKSLQGYLTGFIDLVCCHGGKYYVMDYKSNRLGGHLGDYRPERLQEAMGEHNYGLQYWIYTLMLHRYLQTAMDGYTYAEHFGGVKYLFLRGMDPARPGSGVSTHRPDLATLERLEECLCSTSSIPGGRDTGASLPLGRASSIPGARDTGASLPLDTSHGGSENG